MKEKTKKLLLAILSFVLMSVGGILGTVIIDQFLSGETPKPYGIKESIAIIAESERCQQWFLIFEIIALVLALSLVIFGKEKYKSKTIKVTDDISIPVSEGQGQHGTARFMTEKEFKKQYQCLTIDRKSPTISCLENRGQALAKAAKDLEKYGVIEDVDDTAFENISFNFPKKAGLVIDVKRSKKSKFKSAKWDYAKEKIYTITKDIHMLIIGGTGAGKTRRMVIPTLCSLALAGESIIVTDPKGEIYAFTNHYLKSLGYEVCMLNFFDMAVSMAYNPLQTVIDAVNEGNMSLAASRAWDITSFLVEKNDRSEPIWSNGEMSVIAAAILCVVCDNVNKPQFQNLTNVYAFIANMSKPVSMPTGERTDDGKMITKMITPLTEYIKVLPEDHPAKPILSIAEIAPEKTVGSFYTSALTTLRLYTSEDVYNITKTSEFRLDTLGSKRQALFFVLPDSKTTYYPIVSLVCSQIYDLLTETAKRQGNVLNNRVNYILDEFGNFSKIPDFCTMLTVGRGYGIRFNLFVQSFAQLEEKYEKTGERIIKDNCSWICLAANDLDTQKEFEDRLGEYTTTAYSLTNSEGSDSNSGSRSSNVNLMARKLLTNTEIAAIRTPYLLLSENGKKPAITYLPELSKWHFNRILGLGDQDHNKLFITYVSASYKRREWEKLRYWNIWNLFSEKGVTLKNLSQKIKEALYGSEEEPADVVEFGFVPEEQPQLANKTDLSKNKQKFEQSRDITLLKEDVEHLREEVRRLDNMVNNMQNTDREEKRKAMEELRTARDELFTAQKALDNLNNKNN